MCVVPRPTLQGSSFQTRIRFAGFTVHPGLLLISTCRSPAVGGGGGNFRYNRKVGSAPTLLHYTTTGRCLPLLLESKKIITSPYYYKCTLSVSRQLGKPDKGCSDFNNLMIPPGWLQNF
jgi:hypothetical protein